MGWVDALLRVCRSAWVTFGCSLRASRYMGFAHQARIALFFTHGWVVEAVCGLVLCLVWVISGGLRSLVGFYGLINCIYVQYLFTQSAGACVG